MLNDADSAEATDGVKYIVNVQMAPAASEPLQGGSPALVAKSALFAPVILQAVNLIGEPLTFVIVTVD